MSSNEYAGKSAQQYPKIPDERHYLDRFEESIDLKLANEEIVKF